MSALCQLSSDSFLNAIIHRKTSQSSERSLAGGIRIERILTVFCTEAWRRDRVLRHHAEFNMVENAIESRLILQIAARYTDGNDAFAFFKDYCGRERDARAFAGLDTVRMARCSVEAPESVAVRYSQLATDRVRSVAAGRGCHQVPPTIGYDTGSCASGSRPLRTRPLDGFHVDRVARADLR